MGRGDKRDPGRGWSLVFDDRTDQARTTGPAVDAPENATIIDQDISEEIKEALRRRAESALEHNETDEALLVNVPVADVALLPDSPEHTVRSAAPNFDETPMVDVETDPRGVAVRTIERDTDEHDQAVDDSAPTGEQAAYSADSKNANDEKTRKAPIPYDLFTEQPLPKIERQPPKITRRKVTPIPKAAPKQPRSQVPHPPARSGSETMLDLAAQLGLPPDARVVAPDDDPTADDPKQRETMEIPRSPNDEIDLSPFLESDDKDRDGKKKPAVPLIRQNARPSEGMGADNIQRLATGADAAARTIPAVLAIFVLVGTITALIMLFSTGGRQQHHVEMRFLSLEGPRHSAVRTSDTPTRFTIETVPEGVFVLYGQEIIGKSPVVADLHIALDKKVGVELSGPYFEKWIGEIERDSSGEYQITVELKRK